MLQKSIIENLTNEIFYGKIKLKIAKCCENLL